MNEKRTILDIFLRYSILIVVAIPNLFLFYYIFTPLTIYPVYFLLGLFFNANLVGNMIFLNGNSLIEIIEACVIGSAYYLLLILNLTIPQIKLKKRIKAIIFSFGILLLINIFRIFLLSVLFASKSDFFEIAHKFLWYFGSIVIVILIWFLTVRIFKIKKIPVYSDFKTVLKNIRKGKRKK